MINFLGYRQKSLDLGLPASFYFSEEFEFEALHRLHREYLTSSGWLESKSTNHSVRSGKFIPWTTYAFTFWVESKDLSDLSICEFGSGASTIFWSNHFREVVSIESDLTWFNSISDTVTDLGNVKIFTLEKAQFQSLSSCTFEKELQHYFDLDKGFFPEIDFEFNQIAKAEFESVIRAADWIFIDGGPRNFYTKLALGYAKEDAIFILDNANEIYVEPSKVLLKSQGYVEVPFHSLGPLNPFAWTTSVFTRNLKTFI